ncbi:Vgb family protein [Nocardia sp. NBC_00565]|uniref:Vgb family protein n=1 Tax=Nocardia sp. NBC_00565 TaxID=2975993 RepID=UPI003FA5E8E6
MPSASADISGDGYTLVEYAVTSTLAEPCNVQGISNRYLWEIEQEARVLGRIDLETGNIVKIQLPPVTLPEMNITVELPGLLSAGPCDIALGGDGKLWFNDQYNNSVGWIDPISPDGIHEISLPTPLALPMSLATGADGNIYITETAANKVAKVDVATHKVDEFPVPTPISGLIGGTAGQDGAHWFVEMAGNKLLSMDYATNAMQEYPIPTPNSLPFVVRSYEGSIWFTESGVNAIGRFDPRSGEFSQVPLPTAASVPIGLARGVDGDLYTDESIGGKIARIDPSTMSTIAEYPIPSPQSFPDEIKLGPDGAIWVPELLNGKIARLWVNSWGADPGFPHAPS